MFVPLRWPSLLFSLLKSHATRFRRQNLSSSVGLAGVRCIQSRNNARTERGSPEEDGRFATGAFL